MEPASPDCDQQDACTCPISHQLMRDPVVAADGHSYDRDAIERWIKVRTDAGEQPTSPCTGAALAHTDLLPNHALRNAIQAFSRSQLAKHPAEHQPSPEPPAKRAKQTGGKSILGVQTYQVHIDMQRAQELVDAGDVAGLLGAMRTIAKRLNTPEVRAHMLGAALVAALSVPGIEPIHDSLHCQQSERDHLVLLQALAVAELSASDLASVDPTLAGAIAALNCAVSTLSCNSFVLNI